MIVEDDGFGKETPAAGPGGGREKAEADFDRGVPDDRGRGGGD
jgi:hypothetical protein